jgi:hypothetical protein
VKKSMALILLSLISVAAAAEILPGQYYLNNLGDIVKVSSVHGPLGDQMVYFEGTRDGLPVNEKEMTSFKPLTPEPPASDKAFLVRRTPVKTLNPMTNQWESDPTFPVKGTIFRTVRHLKDKWGNDMGYELAGSNKFGTVFIRSNAGDRMFSEDKLPDAIRDHLSISFDFTRDTLNYEMEHGNSDLLKRLYKAGASRENYANSQLLKFFAEHHLKLAPMISEESNTSRPLVDQVIHDIVKEDAKAGW